VQTPAGEPRILPARDEGAEASRHAARAAHTEAGAPVRAAKSKPPPEDARASLNSPRLPAAPDATWYTAQDIDIYPRAAVPLRLVPPEGSAGAGAGARLLLWLRIDERGEIVEVSAGEPGIPAAWLDAARKSLAAIRFTPARKDDQPVRSRLLLGVSFAPAGTRD